MSQPNERDAVLRDEQGYERRWTGGWVRDARLGEALALYTRACTPRCSEDLHQRALSVVREVDDEIARLRKEVDALRADAERLEWLHNYLHANPWQPHGADVTLWGGDTIRLDYGTWDRTVQGDPVSSHSAVGPHLRHVIDIAMRETAARAAGGGE